MTNRKKRDSLARFFRASGFGWLGFGCLIIAIALGTLLRFYHLSFKPPWHDEIFTLIWISGLSPNEIKTQTFSGLPLSPSELVSLLSPQPGTTLSDTLHNLALRDPQHPPLYYAGARLWAIMLNSAVIGMRGLAALGGALVILGGYWLGRELFPHARTALMLAALLALSPFHLIYAQEGRPFSLWTLMIVVASAALLRARRLNTIPSWLIYAITIALGLYTFPFFLFTVLGHGLYCLGVDGLPLRQLTRRYGLSGLLGSVAFIPWAWVMVEGLQQAQAATRWTAQPVPWTTLVKTWAANTSRLFFDLNFDVEDPLLLSAPGVLVMGCLVAYSLYSFSREAPKQAQIFLWLLIGTSALPLVGADLLLGGQRSAIARYLLPTALGFQIAVAYVLASHWQTREGSNIQRRSLWQGITLLVIGAGLVSCMTISQSETWWTQKISHHHPEIARLINASPQPLVIANTYRQNFGEVLALSYSLEGTVTLQLFPEEEGFERPTLEDYSDVYLLRPSRTLRQTLAADPTLHMEEVYPGNWLWALKSSDYGHYRQAPKAAFIPHARGMGVERGDIAVTGQVSLQFWQPSWW
ncbi:glycosyltransferase family 39 protein [Leptolyngbya sp. PCC 6406]|uniref:glycosyltransferase family 39 protein n=1 Tax=Leptolyngbya sp. PCC 6406 TaxID=1173264 RepID=UPI0002AC0191|nr:glycosyltransferase family 39 protein [Leptolyngbya sp. PCC 6406]